MSTVPYNAGSPDAAADGLRRAASAAASRRGRWPMMVTVFVVAAALRAGYLWDQASRNPLYYYPSMDAKVHHDWAKQIADGAGMDAKPYFRAPLYYYLLGWSYKLFGQSPGVGRIGGAVLGAAACVLIALLAGRLAGRFAAWVAGLMAACYWPGIYFDGEILSVTLEVVLNTAVLLTLLRAAERRSGPYFALAGVLLGLSAITRPNILVFAPGIAAWMVWPRRDGESLKRRVRDVFIVGAAAAAAILPVTIRNYVVSGEWVLVATNGGVNFYIGNNAQANGYAAAVPGTRGDWWGGYEDTHLIPARELGRTLSESEVSDYWYRKAWVWIQSDPAAAARLFLEKIRLFWSPVEIPNNQSDWFFASLSRISVIFWLGFPVIAVVGLGAIPLLRGAREWSLILIFLLLYMVSVAAFFCCGRYRAPVAPALIVLSAAGLARTAQCLGPRPQTDAGAERRADAASPTAARVAAAAVTACGAGVFLYFNPPDRDYVRRYQTAEGYDVLGNYAYHGMDGKPPDPHKAVEFYRKGLEFVPEHPWLLRHLATALVYRRDYAEALRLLEPAFERNLADIDTRMLMTATLYTVGRRDDALSCARQAVQFAPYRAEAHQQLGAILAKMNRPAEAAAAFDAALRIDPELTESRIEFGLALDRLNRGDEAAVQFEEALKRKPNEPRALANLGNAYARRRQFGPAIDLYQRAIAASPGMSGALLPRVVQTYKFAGRNAEVIPLLEKLLAGVAARPTSEPTPDGSGAADDPSDGKPAVMAALAFELATTPDDALLNAARALELANKAVAASSEPSPEALDALAAAQAASGDFESAAATIREALDVARAANRPSAALVPLDKRLRHYEQKQVFRQQARPAP